MSFVHLSVRSSYSLCESTLSVSNIVGLAKKYKMPAIALTDKDNMFGAMEFCLACQSDKLQPIMGATIRLDSAYEITLIVKSEQGYINLSHLMSSMYLKDADYKNVTLKELAQYSQGLILLSGYDKGLIGQNLVKQQKDKAIAALKDFRSIFNDCFYMEIQRHNAPDQDAIEADYVNLAYDFDVPLVATNAACFEKPSGYEALDALMCIGQNRYVVEDDRDKASQEQYFKTPLDMKALFDDLPEAIENTLLIRERCAFMLSPQKAKFPPFLKEGEDENTHLYESAKKGLEKHFLEHNINDKQTYYDRLDFEFSIIKNMGFSGYFLIVADFIAWAKAHGIPVGPGRGSGAGSVVAWGLTITDIDPLKYNLVFERFLNPERISMPDFDIDFCQDRRDEVIAYVQQRYGHKNVAHIVTFGTLQPRAALRDIGRVLQIPYPVVDKICKAVLYPSLKDSLKDSKDLQEAKQEHEKLFDIAFQLEGLYRHASTHAAGVVIGGQELQNIVPLYREPGGETPSTQFSMKFIEKAGLLKFDFLGLKTLTVINDCAQSIGLDIRTIPLDDKKTFALLCQAKTCGIFQFEGQGFKDPLLKIKPDCFEDLIALVALNRPGPMESIPTYVARKHGLEPVTLLDPRLEPILRETYGVIVYQEHVMQIARALADYSMAEADLLRYAMGKKVHKEMQRHHNLFLERTKNIGIKPDVAEEIYGQMAKFSSYGFPKAHATTYALLSYQTAYLKAHFPETFFACLMNHDMQNVDKLKTYYEELKDMDIAVLPPCINKSSAHFTLEDGAIRYGLGAVKNVGIECMKKIVHARGKAMFKSLDDFFKKIKSAGANKRQIEFLVQAGAFDTLRQNRSEVYKNVEGLLKFHEGCHKQKSLFEQAYEMVSHEDWNFDDKLTKEHEAIGFYLTNHPLEGYKPFLQDMRLCETDIVGFLNKRSEKVSKSGKKYAFLNVTTLDKTYGLIIFSESLERYRKDLVDGQIYIFKCSQSTDRFIVQEVHNLQDKIELQPLVVDFDPHVMSLEKIKESLVPGTKTHLTLKAFFQDECFDIKIPCDRIPMQTRRLFHVS